MMRASSPRRNSAGQTRLPTFSTMSRSRSVERHRRQRRAHHVRVEVALAAEAAAGVELRHGHVQVRRGGRRRGTPRRRPPARRRAGRRGGPDAPSTRSSSVVLPAPGALMTLSDRHAVAVEVRAVGARDRVVGVQRVLDDPDPHAVHPASSVSDTSMDSTSSSSPLSTATSAVPHARAAERRDVDLPRLAARRRSAAAPGTTSCSSRAPSQTVSRATIPNANSSASGTTWRRRPQRRLTTVTRRPPAWLDRGVHDGRRDRELVHQAW